MRIATMAVPLVGVYINTRCTPSPKWIANSNVKVPPEDVIEDLIKDIEATKEEVRPRLSNVLYENGRELPNKALELLNSIPDA